MLFRLSAFLWHKHLVIKTTWHESWQLSACCSALILPLPIHSSSFTCVKRDATEVPQSLLSRTAPLLSTCYVVSRWLCYCEWGVHGKQSVSKEISCHSARSRGFSQCLCGRPHTATCHSATSMDVNRLNGAEVVGRCEPCAGRQTENEAAALLFVPDQTRQQIQPVSRYHFLHSFSHYCSAHTQLYVCSQEESRWFRTQNVLFYLKYLAHKGWSTTTQLFNYRQILLGWAINHRFTVIQVTINPKRLKKKTTFQLQNKSPVL